MKLSVVIPCYNERATLAAILAAVEAIPCPDKEIIVVDDGSRDGSRQMLQGEFRSRFDILVLHERNRGKGAALKSGFAAATGDIVIVQDADLEYDPGEIPEVIAPILRGEADVVYGSRFCGGKPRPVTRFWHRMGNRALTLASNMFTDLALTDMETCYKAFRRELIQSFEIEEERFGFEPEITAKIAAARCRVYEVPISYRARSYAEGKHIGWRDGFRALYCIVKYNLRRRLRLGARPAAKTPWRPAPAAR